jgi:hypothetical protein
MKYRTDFITNSSSSSFVCYGINISKIKQVSPEILLQSFNEKFNEIKERKIDDTRQWLIDRYREMKECNTDAEKIQFMEAHYSLEGNSKFLRIGGSQNDQLGITLTTLIEKFPLVTLKDIPALVAIEINKTCGTNFDPSDIQYYEEGWYEG